MPVHRRRTRALIKKTRRIKHPKSARIASHTRTIGVWLLMIGFLLIAFPPTYKSILSRLQKQPPTGGSVYNEQTAENRSLFAVGPIRIHQQLLGTRESAQSPLRVVIPTVNIDLPIVEANVVDGYWEISETTASHGVGSANPGEIGNTVLFAHARADLFGPVRELKKDDVLYVLTKDRWHRYAVLQTKLVEPKDIEVIASTDEEILTLFTCSGFLDTKRLIVTATPLLF